ncbi:hypothetical protein KC217_19740, partial [Mycobacterium tuberculosis]|nr:hypothetical protein [Mycobacterium tuberculosis]
MDAVPKWLQSIKDDGYRTDNERCAAEILLKLAAEPRQQSATPAAPAPVATIHMYRKDGAWEFAVTDADTKALMTGSNPVYLASSAGPVINESALTQAVWQRICELPDRN